MVRKKLFVTLLTTLAFYIFAISVENVASAASKIENRDSFYSQEFEKFSSKFEQHIQQFDKCIAEMRAFQNQDTELSFNGPGCSRLEEMRLEAERLYSDARALLEKYIEWINSLTESTFKELVKHSNTAQSTLLTSMRSYLDKYEEVLRQSEQVMQKQSQRLREMEQKVEEAERQIESRQGG